MTKSELKPGYVVRYRDGNFRMVMPLSDRLIIVEMEDRSPLYCNLTDFNENLIHNHITDLDIVEVYGFSNSLSSIWRFEKQDRPLLWKRYEKKKYTYAQLREILGEEFEVVNE